MINFIIYKQFTPAISNYYINLEISAGNSDNLPFVENMDIQYAQSGIYTPSDFQFSRDAIAAEYTPNRESVIN